MLSNSLFCLQSHGLREFIREENFVVDIFGISKFYQYKSQRICKRIIFKFQIIFVIFQKKLRPFFWVGKSKVFFSFF